MSSVNKAILNIKSSSHDNPAMMLYNYIIVIKWSVAC